MCLCACYARKGGFSQKRHSPYDKCHPHLIRVSRCMVSRYNSSLHVATFAQTQHAYLESRRAALHRRHSGRRVSTMYDLNLRIRSVREKDKQHMLKRAYELGYSCVAWTSSCFGKVGLGNNASHLLKPNPPPTLDRKCISDAKMHRCVVTENEDIRQLFRLTVAIDDVNDAHVLTVSNETLRLFDLVAVCPANAKVFTYLCTTAEVDIISLDFTHRVPFPLNKKLLDKATSRGIHFEIIYSPMLASAAGRREILSNTRLIIQYLRGRSILLSSGAETSSQLRGCLDVEGIGLALGLTKDCAKKAVAEGCASVIQHAALRRRRYLPGEVMTMSEVKARYPEAVLLATQSASMRIENDDPLVSSPGIDINAQRAGGKKCPDSHEDDASDAEKNDENSDGFMRMETANDEISDDDGGDDGGDILKFSVNSNNGDKDSNSDDEDDANDSPDGKDDDDDDDDEDDELNAVGWTVDGVSKREKSMTDDFIGLPAGPLGPDMRKPGSNANADVDASDSDNGNDFKPVTQQDMSRQISVQKKIQKKTSISDVRPTKALKVSQGKSSSSSSMQFHQQKKGAQVSAKSDKGVHKSLSKKAKYKQLSMKGPKR